MVIHLKRIFEAIIAVLLFFGAYLALGCADWIVADDYYVTHVVDEAYVYTNVLYIVPSLTMLVVYGVITWRILAGKARFSMRFVAALFLAAMIVLHIGWLHVSALFLMPGWFALLGKVCYVVVALYPAVWLFLPWPAQKKELKPAPFCYCLIICLPYLLTSRSRSALPITMVSSVPSSV